MVSSRLAISNKTKQQSILIKQPLHAIQSYLMNLSISNIIKLIQLIIFVIAERLFNIMI